MTIVRTKSVELSTIPAIAYKQKLTSGGAGIKILRLDTEATAAATLDKSTGEPEQEIIDMVNSDEYQTIIERYSDEKGKLNYALMNKDFIKFASKSKTVADMVANSMPRDEILTFIIKSRATFIADKKESLDDEHIKILIETLDEINTRSAFKELKNFINKLLSKKRS